VSPRALIATTLRRLRKRAAGTGARPTTVRFGLLRGLRLSLNPDHDLQREFGLVERELHPWFRRLARGIHSAVDLGAAQGEYTLFFLRRTSATTVLAFEAQASQIPTLTANLALNSLEHDPRLQVLMKFVGSALNDGEVTLDDYEARLAGPCLIKMDIERNEYPVLVGCPKLVARPDVRWIIEVHTPELDAQCRALLEQAGYRVVGVRDAWWRRVIPETRSEFVAWLVAFKPEA
jgi:hypothetical protein